MTLDDFMYLHFAVIIFGFGSDACMINGIYEKDGYITAHKPYYALIIDTIDANKSYNDVDEILVTFINDSRQLSDLRIPIELFNNVDISIYPQRTDLEYDAYIEYKNNIEIRKRVQTLKQEIENLDIQVQDAKDLRRIKENELRELTDVCIK